MTDTNTNTNTNADADADATQAHAGSSATAGASESTDTAQPEDERTRVLRMVADGRISVDEAVALLQALGSQESAAGPEHERHHAQHAQHQWGWRVPGPGPWPFTRPFPQPFPGPWGRGFGPFAQGRRGGPWRGPGGFGGPGGRGPRPAPGGGPEADVVFHVGAPPPVPPAPPVPPVPPVPGVGPVPPVPPVPPAPPFFGFVNRDLVFEVQHEGNRSTARLPIGLLGEFDRFLPRPIRAALEGAEVDATQLFELVNNMDPNHGGLLLDVQHDGNRLRVGIEIPGHPELGKAF